MDNNRASDWAWNWMTKGLEGIVNRLDELNSQAEPMPPSVLSYVEKQLELLNKIVSNQKCK